MIPTSAMKGQLTKITKMPGAIGVRFRAIRRVFEKQMPREQAKHAARKYLSGLNFMPSKLGRA